MASSQNAPTAANGMVSITRIVSPMPRKFRYSSRNTITTVTGTAIFRRSDARCMYSYWPDQVRKYPDGSSTWSATTCCARLT